MCNESEMMDNEISSIPSFPHICRRTFEVWAPNVRDNILKTNPY